ncbi:MAG: class I SAM-dependent methyltransferase [Elusimicrobia bacterium]|nr:class I SAM-dependent methyltransferase [Elusimicrobiota bacterium]
MRAAAANARDSRLAARAESGDRLARRLDEAFRLPREESGAALQDLFARTSLDQFIAYYVSSHGAPHYAMPWRGRLMTKLPFDFALYPALLEETKPRVLLEVGSQRGTSSLYFASLVSPWGGEVVSVDINEPPALGEMEDAGIRFIHGDATDEATANRIRAAIGGRSAMVVDDGSHSYRDVLAAARLYSAAVPPGGYYVVEDAFSIRLNEGGRDPDALDAVDDFLAEQPSFERDTRYDRFVLLSAFRGILRRRV